MINRLKKIFSSSPTSKRIYLDYAGATPVSILAQEALVDSLNLFGNPSGIHKEGREAGLLLDKARALCANTLNAHAYEIYFASSGTESCNMAITGTYEGFATDAVIPHIITTEIEHPAVLEPIRKLEKEKKVSVTYLPVYENGIVKINDLREALRDETILVSVMYANNEIGTMQPVKEIGRLIDEWKKQHGRSFAEYPYFHTDACQVANYCNLDVLRLKCHLMTVNSSKCYGPKGAAILYKREAIKVSPSSFGGGQERGLRSGTENIASLYAFAKALEESQVMKSNECERLLELQEFTRKELQKEIPEIVFYGAWNHSRVQKKDGKLEKVQTELSRLPNNINCRLPGISSEEMILRLDAKGFAVSHKSACASSETDGSYVLMALGVSEDDAKENIRITMGRSTTKEDMKALVIAMKEIGQKYRK